MITAESAQTPCLVVMARRPDARFFLAMLVLFALCGGLSVAQTVRTLTAGTETVLYVAPDGNDAWSGLTTTPSPGDGPFATPQRALQAARELRSQPLAPNHSIRIRLRGGRYELAQPLVITPADSGTTSAPLIIEAARGERPTLSGGRVLRGWTVQADDRWRATLPEVRAGAWTFHQLFVNGQRRQRPRLPRQGYYTLAGLAREQEIGARRFSFLPGQIQPWRNLGDVEVVVFHQWVTSRHAIESVDATSHTVTLKDGAHWLFGTFEPAQRFYVENVGDALGEPGDWYLDRPSGILTYVPLPGESPETTEVIAPMLRTLVRFEGDPATGSFVEHVSIRGLSFMHSARGVAPADMANENQSSVDGFDGAIRASGLRNAELIDCEVTHVGEHAIWLREGCTNNRIERCHLHDLGGGGIYIGEAQIPHEQGRAAPQAALQTGGTHIDNNYVHDGGHITSAGVGIFIGHSAGNRVTHNEVSNFSHLGISVGRSWGYAPSEAHHNQIEFNRVHHIANGVLSDAGGIYMLGVSPGTTIRHNVVHHVVPFNPRLLANGIYLDEGSSQMLVENNLVHDVEGCAFLLHFGHANFVRNNVFVTSGSLDPFCFRKALDNENQLTFERNIVIDSGRADWFPKFAAGAFASDHNLFWDASGMQPRMNGHTWVEWQALGHDRNSRFADPLFVDLAAYDLQLREGSPAKVLGFTPFDPDAAGLYGDTAWITLPTHYPNRPLADRTQPPPPAPAPIHTDFEQQAVNEWPWGAITWAMLHDKRNTITDEAAAGGRHSLKLTSSYTYYQPRMSNAAIHVACDVMVSATQQGPLHLQLRDWSVDPYRAGPYITFHPDGVIHADGQEVGRVPAGQWMHMEIHLQLRKGAPGYGTYRLHITSAGAAPIERTLALPDLAFSELTWLGLVPSDSLPCLAYIDNLECQFSDSPG